jgi:hypothetical protein
MLAATLFRALLSPPSAFGIRELRFRSQLLPHKRKCCGESACSQRSGGSTSEYMDRTPLRGLMQCRIEQVLAFELGRVARLLTPHRLQAR